MLGLVRRRESPFPSFLPTLWTHPLFSSPCNTCLFLLFLTASQAFLQCHSSPSQSVSQTDSQPPAFTATQCINQAFGSCCKTMSPASTRVQVRKLVPSEILHLSWTSRNLTVREKLILHLLGFTFAQLSAPSNEVKREKEKFHSHSHL